MKIRSMGSKLEQRKDYSSPSSSLEHRGVNAEPIGILPANNEMFKERWILSVSRIGPRLC